MSLTQQIVELLKPENQPIIDFSGSWFGTVCPDGPAHPLPTDFNQGVFVILPEFDKNHFWGPCFWHPRDTVSMPQEGDLCLVTFDNRRNLWVTCWWPF